MFNFSFAFEYRFSHGLNRRNITDSVFSGIENLFIRTYLPDITSNEKFVMTVKDDVNETYFL